MPYIELSVHLSFYPVLTGFCQSWTFFCPNSEYLGSNMGHRETCLGLPWERTCLCIQSHYVPYLLYILGLVAQYHISVIIRQNFFLPKQSQKLDLSYMMDLDLWNC